MSKETWDLAKIDFSVFKGNDTIHTTSATTMIEKDNDGMYADLYRYWKKQRLWHDHDTAEDEKAPTFTMKCLRKT
jgi:hypothetical protein